MLLVLLLAAVAPARRDPRVEALAQRIEPAALQATVAKLVGFGTRHTLSETRSETRGIGAARRWLAAQFGAAAQDTRLKPFEDRFTTEPGRRVPTPRSEEHTSELQSRRDLVCRLLLEKKK